MGGIWGFAGVLFDELVLMVLFYSRICFIRILGAGVGI